MEDDILTFWNRKSNQRLAHLHFFLENATLLEYEDAFFSAGHDLASLQSLQGSQCVTRSALQGSRCVGSRLLLDALAAVGMTNSEHILRFLFFLRQFPLSEVILSVKAEGRVKQRCRKSILMTSTPDPVSVKAEGHVTPRIAGMPLADFVLPNVWGNAMPDDPVPVATLPTRSLVPAQNFGPRGDLALPVQQLLFRSGICLSDLDSANLKKGFFDLYKFSDSHPHVQRLRAEEAANLKKGFFDLDSSSDDEPDAEKVVRRKRQAAIRKRQDEQSEKSRKGMRIVCKN